MQTENQLSVWMDSEQTRFFLLPDRYDLPDGDYVIRTLPGGERRVDEKSLAPFEITQKAAQNLFQSQVDQVLEQVKDKLDTSGLGELIAGLTQALESTQGQDVGQAAAAREQIHALREKLEAQGVSLDERIEALPDQLSKLSAGQAQDLKGLTAHLRQLVDWLESPASSEINIDAVLESFEANYGAWLGMEDKARQQEKKRLEYRESARRAIAQSLQEYGFTPLDADSDLDP